MTDLIATLGFGIDTSQVDAGTHKLDQLKAAAVGAASGHDALIERTTRFQAASATGQQSTLALRQAFLQTSDSLDTLIARFDQVRDRVNATQQTFAVFAQTKNTIDALATSYAQTTTSLEKYYDVSQRLGLTTQETVLGLQRITEALKGQTEAGQAIARTLTDYGVSLKGLSSGDAALVLQQFTDRVRNTADSVEKFRSVTQVTGVTNPVAYAELNNPQYVSPAERLQRDTSDRATKFANDMAIGNNVREAAARKADLELEALRLKYKIGPSTSNAIGADTFGISGLNQGSIDSIVKLDPKNSEFSRDPSLSSSQAQLAAMRVLEAHPNEQITKDLTTRDYRNLGDEGLQFRVISNDAGKSRENYLTKKLPSLYQDIEGRYKEEEKLSTGPLDFENNYLTRSVRRMNRMEQASINQPGYFLGQYQPSENYVENRPPDPAVARALARKAANNIQALSGDRGPSTNLDLADRVRAFDAAGVDESYASAFGVNGGFRKERDLSDTKRRVREGEQPGSAEVSGGLEQAYILQQPIEEQNKTRALLNFARGQGVDVNNLIAKRGEGGGGHYALLDGLTPPEREGFKQVTEINEANTQSIGFRDLSDTQTTQAAIRKRSTADGAGAAQQEAFEQNAKVTAQNDGKTINTELVARMRLAELKEKEKTQASAVIDRINEETTAILKRTRAIEDAAGKGPQERANAAAAAGIEGTVTAAGLARPENDAAKLRAAEQARAAATGVSSGVALQGSAESELEAQKRLLAVAGQRSDVAAKIQRDQQVELSFVKLLADAYGDPAAIKALEATIAKVKELKDQTAEARLSAEELGQALQLNTASTDRDFLSGVAPTQRSKTQRLLELGRQHDAAGVGQQMSDGQQGYDNNIGNVKYTDARYEGEGLPHQGGWNENEKRVNQYSTFQTPTAGARVVADTIRRRVNEAGGHLSFNNFLNGPNKPYAPASDGNVVKPYRQDLERAAGLSEGADIPADDPQKMAAILMAINKREKANPILTQSDALAAATASIERRSLGLNTPRPAADVLKDVNAYPADSPEGRRRDATLRDTQSQQTAEVSQAREQVAPGLATRADQLRFAAAGQTGAAARAQAGIVQNGPNGELSTNAAQQRVSTFDFQAKLSRTTEIGDLSRDIEQQKSLADAYRTGGDAVLKFQVNLKATHEELSRNQEVGSDAVLRQKLFEDATAKTTVALREQIKALDEQARVDGALLKLGPFAGAKDMGVAVATEKADAYDRNHSETSDADRAGLRKSLIGNEQNKQLLNDQAQIRQGFLQIEGAGVSALTGIANKTETAKQALTGFVQTIEQVILKLAVIQPLEKGIGSFLSGGKGSEESHSTYGGDSGDNTASNIFGFLAKFVGAFSKVPGAGGGGGGGGGGYQIIGGVDSTLGGIYAAGGVGTFSRRYAASGDIIDRPTRYAAAGGGGDVMAGEAGTETILPLSRDASGNLGVKSQGGGASHNITVHTPITIQNGGNTPMSQDTQKAVQRQIETSARTAVKQVLADEMRPGGMFQNVRN